LGAGGRGGNPSTLTGNGYGNGNNNGYGDTSGTTTADNGISGLIMGRPDVKVNSPPRRRRSYASSTTNTNTGDSLSSSPSLEPYPRQRSYSST